MADLFEALVAPARRAILDELFDRDGQTLFELCARLVMKHDLGLTRQAISQHLEVLESAGLLITERKGRYKFHYLQTAPLEEIARRWLKPKSKRARDQSATGESGRPNQAVNPNPRSAMAAQRKERQSISGKGS